MFENISKYILWDLTVNYYKILDENTTKLLYEGEERGQGQRFRIVLGDLINEMFDLVEKSYYSYDPTETTIDMLRYIQRQHRVQYVDDSYEELLRELLTEIITAWRFKGTVNFLHWIIWKVFGWQLVEFYNKSKLLYFNKTSSYLYDPDKPLIVQKILFDADLFNGTEILGNLIIDVFLDTEYLEKQPAFENLLKKWCYPVGINYVNIP